MNTNLHPSIIFATIICISCGQETKNRNVSETPKSRTENPRELFIASGAGYRKPVNELKAIFERAHGVTVNCVYGNMTQITSQTKNSGRISLLIGDKKFLENSGLSFIKESRLGKGKLVLVFDQGLGLNTIGEITRPDIDKIILPDAQKAIYGKAADQALKTLSLYNRVKNKLVIVQTLPQVVSYLMSGAAKAGFINTADLLSLDSARFSSIEVAPSSYEPIVIEAALTEDASPDGKLFYEFTQSAAAREVFAKYGLGLK